MTITLTDLLTGLEAMARQSDDAAVSCEAAAERHRPEWELNSLVDPPDAIAVTHARALELYHHVIGNGHEAKRLRRDAEVLRSAAERLRRYRGALLELADIDRAEWGIVSPLIATALKEEKVDG